MTYDYYRHYGPHFVESINGKSGIVSIKGSNSVLVEKGNDGSLELKVHPGYGGGGDSNHVGEGENSIALGVGSAATQLRSMAIGNSRTIKENAIAIGYANLANGVGSTVIGNFSNTSGSQDVSLGGQNNVGGTYSVAVGYQNVATGDMSTALGYNNKVEGINSVAIGSEIVSTADNIITLGGSGQDTVVSRVLEIGKEYPTNLTLTNYGDAEIKGALVVGDPVNAPTNLTVNGTANIIGEAIINKLRIGMNGYSSTNEITTPSGDVAETKSIEIFTGSILNSNSNTYSGNVYLGTGNADNSGNVTLFPGTGTTKRGKINLWGGAVECRNLDSTGRSYVTIEGPQCELSVGSDGQTNAKLTVYGDAKIIGDLTVNGLALQTLLNRVQSMEDRITALENP